MYQSESEYISAIKVRTCLQQSHNPLCHKDFSSTSNKSETKERTGKRKKSNLKEIESRENDEEKMGKG